MSGNPTTRDLAFVSMSLQGCGYGGRKQMRVETSVRRGLTKNAFDGHTEQRTKGPAFGFEGNAMRRLMISCFLISILGLLSAGRVSGDTFTWQLPSSLTIAPGNYDTGSFFSVLDVPYFENGVAQSPGFLQFYNSDPMVGGGFVLADSGLDTLFIDAFGPQVYSGMESAPTFVPGTYILNSGLPDGPLATLVIAPAGGTEDSFTYQFPAPTSTPEPSSLLLSLIGTGMLALLCFTRKKIHV
jgi:hypothetical protein